MVLPPSMYGRRLDLDYSRRRGSAGVALHLADDLPGTDSKAGQCGGSDAKRCPVLRLLRSRLPTTQAPTASGQKGIAKNYAAIPNRISSASSRTRASSVSHEHMKRAPPLPMKV